VPKMSANKDLKTNNMDAPPHKEIYEQGYEMRKRVVGEEYVERSLKASESDFMRPLQQFATVCFVCLFSTALVSGYLSIEIIFISGSLNLMHGVFFCWGGY
jgi:hypothetical protein